MLNTSRITKIEKKNPNREREEISILHLRWAYVSSGNWPEHWSPARSKYGVLQYLFSALSDEGGFCFNGLSIINFSLSIIDLGIQDMGRVGPSRCSDHTWVCWHIYTQRGPWLVPWSVLGFYDKTPITLLLSLCRNHISCSLPPFAAPRLNLQKVQEKKQNIYNSKASWLETAIEGKISIKYGVSEEGETPSRYWPLPFEWTWEKRLLTYILSLSEFSHSCEVISLFVLMST